VCSARDTLRASSLPHGSSGGTIRGLEQTAVLEAVVPYNLAHFPENARDCDVVRLVAGWDLEKFAGDLILAASIATPGTLEPSEIQCSVDDRVCRTLRLRPTSLADAREEADEIGWPSLSNLPLDACLRRLRAIPGFIEGVLRDWSRFHCAYMVRLGLGDG